MFCICYVIMSSYKTHRTLQTQHTYVCLHTSIVQSWNWPNIKKFVRPTGGGGGQAFHPCPLCLPPRILIYAGKLCYSLSFNVLCTWVYRKYSSVMITMSIYVVWLLCNSFNLLIDRVLFSDLYQTIWDHFAAEIAFPFKYGRIKNNSVSHEYSFCKEGLN